MLICAVSATALGEPPHDLGPNASLHGRRPFTGDSAWNQPIDRAPVDADSDKLIASIGRQRGLHPDFGANWNGRPFGIPYIVVAGITPKVPITFTAYGNESDPGPYPIPSNAPIEGGANAPENSDRHILVVDRDHWKLYELYHAFLDGKGFKADSGAVFDLARKCEGQRPSGWTSADAAGLPIFPGLVRYDEVVEKKAVLHAVRFTCRHTRRAYVSPASHFASRSNDLSLPPMGMRVRLKAGFDISGFPPSARVILQALKTYGMILADNGGDWFISGAPDARWNDEELNALKRVAGDNFEAVKTGR